MEMEIVDGKIVGYDDTGKMQIEARYDNLEIYARRKFENCRVVLTDSRRISDDQRKKAYALLNEIGEYMGEMPEYVKRLFKWKFIAEELRGLTDEIFSLADCDMTTAREFISFLIDFIIEHEIPSRTPLYELCEDVERYQYACLKRKICAVCGRKAELHHIDRVGLGRDRTEIAHVGMKALSLCREHHTEAHTLGEDRFLEKYHLTDRTVIDESLCKIYRVRKERKNG